MKCQLAFVSCRAIIKNRAKSRETKAAKKGFGYHSPVFFRPLLASHFFLNPVVLGNFSDSCRLWNYRKELMGQLCSQ